MRNINQVRSFAVIVIMLCIGLQLKSQGTLEFNQVLYVTTDTVPAAKVWKVTRVFNTISNSSRLGYIDGQTVGSINGSAGGFSIGPSSAIVSFTGSFWLPAGTILSSESSALRWSVIEFNVVP